MFRHLNTSGSGVLSAEEFLNIYDTIMLQWEPQYSAVPWYHSTSQPLQILCTGAHAAIRWTYFEILMCKLKKQVNLYKINFYFTIFSKDCKLFRCNNRGKWYCYDSKNIGAE